MACPESEDALSTITAIGAGTSATANNASVTPVAHASTAADDLVVIAASIRNSGTGVVNGLPGWNTLANFGNIRLFGRMWQTGDVAPAVTFTGGAAGDDTIAQIATWRGASAESLTTLSASATQLNGTATTIAYPALVVPKDRCLVLLAVWRQADSPSISGPAGYTFTASTSATAGNDASQALRSIIQTTATNLASGSLTTGSATSAISRAVVLALKPAASFTATEQAVYPPRVLLSLTDLTIGDAVQLYRQVSGARTEVRAASSAAVTDPSFLRVDAEVPFGVPVTYVAVVNGVEYSTGATTYTLPGGKVALSDAVTGLSAEVTILAWPERQWQPRSTTFGVGGRNVVVSGPRGQYTGTVELYVEATSSLENLYALLDGATQGIIQVRQPGGYDGVDAYWVVVSIPERRFSQDGTDERRVIALDVVEVEPWAESLEALGYTYEDLEVAYTGLTYGDLAGDYATYLALAQADLS